jgi:cytochrome c
MLKLIRIIIVPVIVIVAAWLVVACSGKSSTSPAATTTAAGTTAGQLASAGQTVFVSRCAKCHGDKGQGITGPILIGGQNTLDKYGTAQGLLNFIDTSMPLDAPGSLSQQDYLDVVSFLLVQNNFVSSGTVLAANNLNSVSLK